MAIPDFQSMMLPMLELAGDGTEHSLVTAREALSIRFELSAVDRAELLPSGRLRRFDNRVSWAKVYLQQAGLLISAKRAHFTITELGQAILKEIPERIDIDFLQRFAGFRDFRSASRKVVDDTPEGGSTVGNLEAATPEETLEQACQSLRSDLLNELLAKVKASSPQFFESLVVELLLKMGYGRNRREAGEAIGGVGDEGIDGIISEDRLVLDSIYIQAKRWDGTVGRPEVQKFVGALHGKQGQKGVFITTGSFSSEAVEFVSRIAPRVVLVDGRQLAEFMADYDIGVTAKATYVVKRLDSDYFSEET